MKVVLPRKSIHLYDLKGLCHPRKHQKRKQFPSTPLLEINLVRSSLERSRITKLVEGVVVVVEEGVKPHGDSNLNNFHMLSAV